MVLSSFNIAKSFNYIYEQIAHSNFQAACIECDHIKFTVIKCGLENMCRFVIGPLGRRGVSLHTPISEYQVSIKSIVYPPKQTLFDNMGILFCNLLNDVQKACESNETSGAIICLDKLRMWYNKLSENYLTTIVGPCGLQGMTSPACFCSKGLSFASRMTLQSTLYNEYLAKYEYCLREVMPDISYKAIVELSGATGMRGIECTACTACLYC